MDPMGKAWLKNQTIGHQYIEFKNWPKSYNYVNLALLETEWLVLKRKYKKMMKLGKEVVKLLESEISHGG